MSRINRGEIDLINALEQVAAEKGLNLDTIFEAIKEALINAAKKTSGQRTDVRVNLNRDKRVIELFALKTVVYEVLDSQLQISFEEARELIPYCEVGSIVRIDLSIKDFGRVIALSAKQLVSQKFKQAETELLYDEFKSKQGTLILGRIHRKSQKNIIINMGKIDAMLPVSEQMPNEIYDFEARLKLYVSDVRRTSKSVAIIVSRTHPNLVRLLLKQEIPEIYDGTIEIKSIAREPGNRTKIAVHSNNKNIDPIGSCIGQNGMRVNSVVEELSGEKIDIIKWSDDIDKYVEAALHPCKALKVEVDPKELVAKVVVPNNQLSLAIGKEGQNVRLAVKLTGLNKIDIKSEKYKDEYIHNGAYEEPIDDEEMYKLEELAKAYKDHGIK
jgi:N utilization substance protein A